MLRKLTLLTDTRKYPLSIPWSQLTLYEATEYTYGDNLGALRRLDHVVECDLELHDPDNAIIDPSLWEAVPTILTLPHLRVLTMEESSNPDASLLRALSLPALQYLSIRFHGHNVHFPSMMTRSSCSLTTLLLRGGGATLEHVVEALKKMPTLTTLTVLETDYNTFFLRNLIAKDSYILPNLMVLRIEMESHIPDGELLAEIVQPRCNFLTVGKQKVATLKEFHYVVASKTECRLAPEYVRRFREWQRGGLDIKVELFDPETMVGSSLL